MRWRRAAADGASPLREPLFGDLALDEWPAPDADAGAEPWASFVRARQFVQEGRQDEAATIWQQIGATPGLESRQTLQAWHFLRQAGLAPPMDQAAIVLGVIAEVTAGNGHDLLAAYRDGTARYLNYSGASVVWDTPSADAAIQDAITRWLELGQGLAEAIGVWDQRSLPPLPRGQARVLMLTPGGHRFGQAPDAALFSDPAAGPFLSAAATLMQLLTGRSSG